VITLREHLEMETEGERSPAQTGVDYVEVEALEYRASPSRMSLEAVAAFANVGRAWRQAADARDPCAGQPEDGHEELAARVRSIEPQPSVALMRPQAS
jgi:hypothetical protein